MADRVAEVAAALDRADPSGASARIQFLTDEAIKLEACEPAIVHCRAATSWATLGDGYQSDWAYWMVAEMGALLSREERAFWIALIERDPPMASAMWQRFDGLDEEEGATLLAAARTLPDFRAKYDRGEVTRTRQRGRRRG